MMQHSQTKKQLLQHLLASHSWYNVTTENDVARQKLSFYLVFQLVARHYLNACDISTLSCDKVRLKYDVKTVF